MTRTIPAMLFLTGATFLTVLFSGCRTMPGAVTSVPRLWVPRAKHAPQIDGDLDEDAWTTAAVIERLAPAANADDATVQQVAKYPTEVRVLWDPEWLYVAFRCEDPEVFSTADMEDDSNLYTQDVCEIFLDAGGDAAQVIEIQVSPRGKAFDLIHLLTAEPEYDRDGVLKFDFRLRHRWTFREWDVPGLRTAAGRLHDSSGAVIGWTVEAAVPAAAVLKQFEIDEFEPMQIRANFLRYEHPVTEEGERGFVHMNWSPVKTGCPHISYERMGILQLAGPRVQVTGGITFGTTIHR